MDSFDCTVEADGSLHLTAKRSRREPSPVSAAEAASAAADAVMRERHTVRAAASTSTAVASRGLIGGGGGVEEEDEEDEDLDWLTVEQREVSLFNQFQAACLPALRCLPLTLHAVHKACATCPQCLCWLRCSGCSFLP